MTGSVSARILVAVACALVFWFDFFGAGVGRAHAQSQSPHRTSPWEIHSDTWIECDEVGAVPEGRDAPCRARLTDDVLAERGWMFRRDSIVPGSVGAGIFAMTLGAVWHGGGHFLIGDDRSWRQLLIGEAVALGLIGSGVTLDRALRMPAVEPFAGVLKVSGGSLFAMTWIADVLGSFKGDATRFPPNTSSPLGLAAEVYYAPIVGGGLVVTDLLVLRMPYHGPRGVIVPAIELGPSSQYRSLSLYGGYRWRRAPAAPSFFEWGASITDARDGEADAGRTRVETLVAYELDVGRWLPHLGGLIWRNEVGLSLEGIRVASDDAPRFSEGRRLWGVPASFSLGVNLNRGVHVSGGYRHRRDLLVGGMRERLGSVWGRIDIVPRNRIGIDLMLERGAFTRVWLGLRIVILDTASEELR